MKTLLHILLVPVVFALSTTLAHPIPANSGNLSAPEAFNPCIPIPALPDENDILYGDVNEDDAINVLDIIAMVNYILGEDPDPFSEEAADLNEDDAIDVLDIIFLVNIILAVPGQPCPGLQSITYEGQTYHTILMGDRCWLRENLNVGTMINGADNQADNPIIEKYCYNDDPANCETYGGLYQWPEAMQYLTSEDAQGICPLGWHMPTDAEWKALEGFADSQFPPGDPIWDLDWWRGFDVGGNLKEAGTEHWNEPNTGASNLTGFTALPAGVRSSIDGLFYEAGLAAYFWTASIGPEDFAIMRFLDFEHSDILRYSFEYKESGHSVRCVKGCVPQPSQADAGPDQLDIPDVTAILEGNIPGSGTGEWTITSGTGGWFDDPMDPATGFHGLPGNAYTLEWTITTVCGSTSDDVMISFIAFICGNPFYDDRDGQTYATVVIDNQCWMAENLNTGSQINSTSGGYQQTDNDDIEKYCYGNDPDQCDEYGGLYEWPEAMDYASLEGAQGICPEGWHIPTDDEWKILSGNVDSEFPVGDPEWDKTGRCGSDAGGNLKEEGTVHWNLPNTGATNTSGFTGLPGGYRNIYSGNFFDTGNMGTFWSSSQTDPDMAWSRYLDYSDARISHYTSSKQNGFSVRCLKDN